MKSSVLGDITRGGQIFLHSVRMAVQVIKSFSIAVFAISILFFLFYFFNKTENYDRYLFVKWAQSSFTYHVVNKPETTLNFEYSDGSETKASARTIVSNPGILKSVNQTIDIAYKGLARSIILFLVCFVAIFFYGYKIGYDIRKPKFLRGNKKTDKKGLIQLLRRKRVKSDISIGDMPLVKDSETSHILISGAPGTGKSTAIKDLLNQIRKRGDRAIVYSSSEEFVESFYDEKKDVLLNPMDKRCPKWHIWAEAETSADFDNMAESLIPDTQGGSDPFWNKAARTLFSSVAARMFTLKQFMIDQLLKDLLTTKLETVARLIEGTEAEAIVSGDVEKVALSVRATLAAYIRSLKYLKLTGKAFSISDWIKKDDHDGWIFLGIPKKQISSLRPLITLWLDTAASAILSLNRKRDRRIWIIVDELPTLNKLHSLSMLMAEGRKYGACCVIGFQSFSQLVSIYGLNGAQSMAGYCSTWLLFRTNEASFADWASKSLGATESLEGNEGYSLGANEIRDGVTLSSDRKTRQIVVPGELIALPDLAGFLKLPGFPVAEVELKYRQFKQKAEGFIPDNFEDTSMKKFEDNIQENVDDEEDEVLPKEKERSVDERKKEPKTPEMIPA